MSRNEKYEKHPQLSRLESTIHYARAARLISAQNEKVVIEEPDGKKRELIDLMSSYAAVNFGHCNPHIRPYDNYKGDLVSFFTPIEAENYAIWLCSRLQKKTSRVLFQVGGTSAVSAAIGMAQRNRPGKVVAIEGGFHGLAVDALSASDIGKSTIMQYTDIGSKTEAHFQVIAKNERAVDWSQVSCLIFEPVQGASGMIPLEREWIASLCLDARENGVIVIADEIQCGYYRCGHMSYSIAQGIEADILLFGKSMTNGLFPFSALVYENKLEAPFDRDRGCFAHTYQPSALGCYAAYSVAMYLDLHEMDSRVRMLNEILRAFVDDLIACQYVDQAHVLGPSASMRYVKGNAAAIADICFERSVLMCLGGPENDRFRLMPPLTISPQVLEDGLSVLKTAIENDIKNSK